MNGRDAGKLARGPLLANGMKPVLYLIGLVLLSTAGMMLIPMAVDLYFENPDWQSFAYAAALAGAVGMTLMQIGRTSLQAGPFC